MSGNCVDRRDLEQVRPRTARRRKLGLPSFLFRPPSSALRPPSSVLVLAACAIAVVTLAVGAERPASPPAGQADSVPEPKQVGGEPDGIVQVANLVYAGIKSSHCFSDHFLVKAQKESAISTSRRFHAVKLSAEEVFDFPMVIMTGEGSFELQDTERENLKTYVMGGGFLLVSAGCSSSEWDRAFRREMARIFPDRKMEKVGMDHPIFHTVYDITELKAKHGKPQPLEAIRFSGRIGVLYSKDGLNDTGHVSGCCCCGGNEITNAVDVNVNILAYALLY